MSTAGIERTRQATTTSLGLLDAPSSRPYRLHRWPAPADLDVAVERFWLVGWDTPASGPPRFARLLPHPCVNLVVDETGRAAVAGCGREVFAYPLRGRGAVLGVKFRAGAFRAFLDRDVATLTGRTVPAHHVWPRQPWTPGAGGLEGVTAPLVVRLADEIAAGSPGSTVPPDDVPGPPTPAAQALTDLLTDALRALDPPDDPRAATAGRAVHALLTDPRIRRVADVGDLVALPPRALQRLFRSHVGLTAREVLGRGRMHLVADRITEAVAAGRVPDWPRLAADLGFADQPHFIREFRGVLGQTPSAWAAGLSEPSRRPFARRPS